MSTVTALYGKSTFAFQKTIRCAIQYLEKTGNHSQIPLLPESYPQHQDNLNGIDVAVRAKILKTWRIHILRIIFSVSITRRKDHSVICISYDILRRPDMISEIARLYENHTTKICLDMFVYKTSEQ